MKKQLLAVVIASTFGLTACGESNSSKPTTPTNPTVFDPAIVESLAAETTVLFDLVSDPSSPTIVIPSYLATDKDDQTLSVESTAVNPDDLSDPLVAMGKTDGWSTSQPIDVEFSGYPLDPSSAANSFYLLKSDDPSHPSASSEATLLVEGADYTVKAKGKTLTATLRKPLEPSSNYMFAVTNSLKDTQNNAVGMSFSYAVLKSTNKVPVEKLLPAQTITHNTESAFEQAGVDKSTIIFSSWFKTASVGDVLAGTMYATAQALQMVQAPCGKVHRLTAVCQRNNWHHCIR
ncbi:Ig-like domain-containing protein [Enterovibrio coralii]|uniref:Ig-like domain-containing protein n=1 Tax=Enterovibrio coralii TaxID=294935 RepID=UPI000A5EBE2E|nr:Ig-like domain-containing protein [Enterovibrio coralii]